MGAWKTRKVKYVRVTSDLTKDEYRRFHMYTAEAMVPKSRFIARAIEEKMDKDSRLIRPQ